MTQQQTTTTINRNNNTHTTITNNLHDTTIKQRDGRQLLQFILFLLVLQVSGYLFFVLVGVRPPLLLCLACHDHLNGIDAVNVKHCSQHGCYCVTIVVLLFCFFVCGGGFCPTKSSVVFRVVVFPRTHDHSGESIHRTQ